MMPWPLAICPNGYDRLNPHIMQMVSHVFMADVGHSGQILSYADSAWSCVGNDMPCLLCC